MRGSLKTEIADQATQIPFTICRYAADNVQIPLQALPGSQRFVVQSLFDKLFGACKIAVQDFLGKSFFGTEMIGEGAQRNSSRFADIAHTRCRVARSKHHFEASVEKVFPKGWLAHTDVIIRTYVLRVKRFFDCRASQSVRL